MLVHRTVPVKCRHDRGDTAPPKENTMDWSNADHRATVAKANTGGAHLSAREIRGLEQAANQAGARGDEARRALQNLGDRR